MTKTGSVSFPADQQLELYHVHNDYETSVAMSYHCNKDQTIGFTNGKDGKEIVANATISHVQLEAFHTAKNEQFSTARDCEAIDTPDIVPIAVGKKAIKLVNDEQFLNFRFVFFFNFHPQDAP